MPDLPRGFEALLVLNVDEARRRVAGKVGEHGLSARQEATVEADIDLSQLGGSRNVLAILEIETDRFFHEDRPRMHKSLLHDRVDSGLVNSHDREVGTRSRIKLVDAVGDQGYTELLR
jgi:hypothetical protein